MKITKKFKGMLSLALTAMLTLGSVTTNATTTSKNPALPDLDESKTGSITIHKYGMNDWPNPGKPATGDKLDEADIPNGAVPLKEISFRVEQVEVSGDGTLEASNSTDRYSLVENGYSKEVTTEENGEATTGQIPQGTYLVTEIKNSSVTKPVDPFIVNVPMTNPAGDGWIYNVHVYPKNVLAGEASIDKDVTEEGNKHNTADIGKNVMWIIKPSIPQDIFYSNKYAVVDQLDSQLNYTGSLEVYYYKGNKKVTIDKKYYTAIEPHKFKENEITGPTERQVIKVEFNKEGREFLGSLFANSINSIRISFTTTINKSAELGVAIKNNANLVYTNSFNEIVGSDPTEPGNPDVPGEPDQPTPPTVEVPENQRPEVHTGGVKLLKVDAKSKIVLQGAEFMIYASEEYAKAGIKPLTKPGTDTPWVEVSDEKGIVTFKGLSYGSEGEAWNSDETYSEYWIVETKSPTYIDENGDEKHYNLLKEPLKVTVNATSHQDECAITVKNSKFSLPVTGGVGTVIFTLGGLAIMGAAAFLYMRTTRRA